MSAAGDKLTAGAGATCVVAETSAEGSLVTMFGLLPCESVTVRTTR